VHLSRKLPVREDSLKMLLQAALAGPPSPTDSSPGSSKENHARHMNGGDVPDNKEARQLLAVKKLMEMKGIEAMMKFLES
jgi:hypothetical protein